MSDEKKRIDSAKGADGEFMLEPVPTSARRSTKSQVMVWIGFGYAITGLVVGGNLGGYGGNGGLPPMQAFLAIVLGMGSLFIITSLLGVAAMNTGLNLSLLSRYSYGHKGIVFPMAIMALLTLGWFASITGMVGDIWAAWIGNPSGITVINSGGTALTLEVVLACIVFGAIFTVTAVRGIGAIEKVATIFSPLILIVAIVVGIIFVNNAGGTGAFLEKASHLGGFGLGNGITAVVGSWIAGAVMGVDMFRFNKNTKAVILCAASCFIFTNPILNVVGYIGAVQNGDYNYVIWMLGVNLIVAILGVIVWTTALWTTNNSELYCNSLYTGPVLDAFGISVSRRTLVIICGILGTILGALGFYQLFFANFINILGSMAPPLCAPIIADFFVVRREKYSTKILNDHPPIRWAGVISFLVGAVLGFVFSYVWPLPYGLPAGLVAMVISFIVYIVIYKITPDAKNDDALVAKI